MLVVLFFFFVLYIFFSFFFFFFNDTATTEIYTLSLHDALPILHRSRRRPDLVPADGRARWRTGPDARSEEHTSELQSHSDLVCRLLLEKKKKKTRHTTNIKRKNKYLQ